MGSDNSFTRVRQQSHQDTSALAAVFAADAYELIQLGVRLDKGATLSEGAGLGAAGLAAFKGHWLLAAGAALVGALVSTATQYYKQKKIEDMRNKWNYVLANLDEDAVTRFVLDVKKYYPEIAQALSAKSLGTSRTQRLLTWGR